MPQTRPLEQASPWPPELIGESTPMRLVREQMRNAARATGAVLVVTPGGIRASEIARALHQLGPLPDGPFVTVECGAGDPTAVDTVLFGPRAVGRAPKARTREDVASSSSIVAARGGTLFLQDVTELPAVVQERLARVLRDGEVRVIGEGAHAVRLGLRITASCGPGVEHEVAEGRFRADLYRRLSAHKLDVPPLADRREDIPATVQHLIAEVSPGRVFTDAALGLLAALPWPGNLVELAEVVGRLAIQAPGPVRVEEVLAEIRLASPGRVASSGSLREARRRFEREYVAAVLMQHGWRMSEAARALGMQRTNLYRKARQLGIPFLRRAE